MNRTLVLRGPCPFQRNVVTVAGAITRRGCAVDPNATNHPLSTWDSASQSWIAAHGKLSFYLSRSAGNVDIANTASTTVVFPSSGVRGDVNGDGVVNCQDLFAASLAVGFHTGQPGFLPTADLDANGTIDIRDVAAISRLLPPGTHC